MTDEKRITYAELKEQLDKLTPEQLALPVVWSGDERGGYVRSLWIAEEDWIGDDHESALARSEVTRQKLEEDYEDARVIIPVGTVHLMVD